ncbi:MAG: serine hydrolase [Bacteroidia bacterium]
MHGRLYTLLFISAGIGLVLFATLYRPTFEEEKVEAPFLLADTTWATEQLAAMNEQELLAQLFLLIPSDSLKPDSQTLSQLFQPSPGGLALKTQSPESLWDWQQNAQQHTHTPLLMGSFGGYERADWLDVVADERLGAVQNLKLIDEFGERLAHQYQSWGYHLYFVPGQSNNFQAVNRSAWIHRNLQLVNSLQEQGIIASVTNAKVYFPFETDSLRRDSLLWPYTRLSQKGTASLLLDPSSVQRIKWNSQKRNIIGSYLAGHAEYQGLLISEVKICDISLEDQLLQMVKAGTDMILLPARQYQAAQKIMRDLLQNGELRVSELEAKAYKIFLAKTWSGATRSAKAAKSQPPIDQESIAWLNHRLGQASLSLVQNELSHLPIHGLSSSKPQLVSIGMNVEVMAQRMALYAPLDYTALDWELGTQVPIIPPEILRQADPLILVLPNRPIDSLASQAFWQAIKPLQSAAKLVILQFGEAERLKTFAAFPSLMHAYRQDSIGQELAAQAVFGGISPLGHLPLDLHPRLAYGQGDPIRGNRLAYLPPIALGIDLMALTQIDSVMLEGIDASALPGGQVFVAKAGKVIYHKSFGYHTYQERRSVYPDDLYDIASVTKIAATTIAAMKMTNEGKINPNQRLARFFKKTKVNIAVSAERDTVWLGPAQLAKLAEDSTAESPFSFTAQRESGLKVSYDSLRQGDSLRIIRVISEGSKRVSAPAFRVRLADLMTHYSGLPAGMPILPYLRYRDSTTGKYGKYYKPRPSEKHNVLVAGDFYLRNDYRDSLWEKVRHTIPAPNPGYDYSDLNMILVQRAIDSVNKEPIDLYMDRTFYQPLGLQQTFYLPREKVDIKRIVPTEYDGRWRGQLLRGYVHDPTAALMGGIAGNAGLFANANDLGILFQMLLNGGTYGGERYLEASTIETFTQTRKGHRAYGFDKPPAQRGAYIIAPSASEDSYGHTGFTGTCVWVDPEHELVFVFLSNRVHPKSNNWKLNEMRIRQRVHEAVYDALP